MTRSPDDGGWRDGDVVDRRWEVFGSARGSGGTVHFVRDRDWGDAPLAVKTLGAGPGEPLPNERARQQFFAVTARWRDLGAHPHIASAYYTLDVRGALRFFFEYIPGGSLAAELAGGAGRPPLDLALDLAIQIAAGLEHAHAHGTVHGDIRPGNCLLAGGDTIRISDFGLGRAAARAPLYTPPEQWQAVTDPAPPADVYAFGIILYELLTGQRPFEADPATWHRYAGRVPAAVQHMITARFPPVDMAIRSLHQHAPPAMLCELDPTVPSELEPIAAACLAKVAAERPAAAELRRDLVELHRTVTGRPYRRDLPDPLAPSEAGDNNRALCCYAMGERDLALALLDRHLLEHPTALYPWINRNTLAIRHGERNPADVADRFAVDVARYHHGAVDEDATVSAFRARLARYRFDHPSPVVSLAVSADGASVATGCADRRIRVFALATGAVEETLPEHDDAVGAVCFVAARDGIPAIAAANATVVTLWARGYHQLLGDLRGHEDLVTSMAASADGRLLLSGSNDGTARLWDTATRRCIAELPRHRGIVRAVALSADGAWAATSGLDHTTRIWRVAGKQLVAKLSAPTSVSLALAFSPTAPILATGGGDGVVGLWNRNTGELDIALASQRGGVAALAFSHDGVRLAASGSNPSIEIWDIPTARVTQRLTGHRAPVRTVAFTPDGTSVVSASDDQTARQWPLGGAQVDAWPLSPRRDVAAGGRRERAAEKRRLIALAAAGDPTALATMRAARDTSPDLRRDPELLAAEHALGARAGVARGVREAFASWTAMVGAPIRRVVGGDESTFAATSRRLFRWPAGGGEPAEIAITPAVAIALSSDSSRLLLAGERALELRDARAPQTILWHALWPGRAGAIHSAAMSHDTRLVVAAGWSRGAWSWRGGQGTLRGWLTQDSREVRFAGQGGAVLAVALSADGGRMLGGTDDGSVILWDVATATRARSWKHSASVAITAVAISRSGRYGLSGGADGTLCTWDTAGIGKGAVASIAAHGHRVHSVAIDPDERFAVSAADDGAVEVWLLPALTPVSTLTAHEQAASVCFVTGTELVTAGGDGTIRRWTLDIDWGAPGA